MRAKELKGKLAGGGAVFGAMISATLGMRWGQVWQGSTLDYIVIDAEHGSRDRLQISNLVMLAKSVDLTPIVRVPSTDPVYVAMALDAGAEGVLVPYCETVEEVRQCAAKLRLHPLKGEYLQRAIKTGEYPSEKSREYLERRHKDHLFIMGIESVPAFNRLDALLEASGADGVFVGPNDMTTSLGIPDEVENPRYLDVLREIIAKSEARGVPVMIHQQNIEASRRAIDLGARFVLHSSDAGVLLRGLQTEFAELRGAIAARNGHVDAVEAKDTLDTV
ncbi:MAG: aldolase/citrate lyase family protein [Dehalococcoidia bacterium]